MKKYNLSAIMKRAWEIKADKDLLTLRRLRNLQPAKKTLLVEEKVIFSECLKMAWAEVKRAEEIEEKLKVSSEQAGKIAKKDAELCRDYNGSVVWNIWSNYGKIRAYYKVSGRSNYQNSKSDNFISL